MARLSLAVVAVVVGFVAVPVLAHGTWVDARPLPGVTVGGTVDEVAFLFPEPLVVDAGTISVTGPDDAPHPAAGPLEYPADAVVRLAIEPISTEGTYTVSYTLPATDGFVFTGSHRFEYRSSAPALEPLPYGRGSVVPVVGVVALVVAGGWWVVRRRRKIGLPEEPAGTPSVGSG